MASRQRSAVLKNIISALSVISQVPCAFSQIRDNAEGPWGSAMGAVNGPPVPAGLRRVCLPLPGRAACGSLARRRRRDLQLHGAVRKLRHRLLAAVVLGVVLCMSWTHNSRTLSGFAMLNNHAIATAIQGKSAGAGAGNARCRLPVVFRQGPGSRRQERGRDVLDAYIQSGAATGSPEVSAPGRRGVLADPGIGCGPGRRWLLASHQALPFRFPSRHGRYGIRMLASGKWPTEEPVQPGRGGCVTGKAAEQAQRRPDAAVLDPPPGGAVRGSRADGTTPVNLEVYRLRASPCWPASLTCVIPSPDRQRAGTRSPERWCSVPSGTGGQTGAGDRASLPGRSTRYRVIWFVCPRCGARMECLFYDEGDMALCRNALHGQMEIQR
jgi:hypothetical protein